MKLKPHQCYQRKGENKYSLYIQLGSGKEGGISHRKGSVGDEPNHHRPYPVKDHLGGGMILKFIEETRYY